MSSGQEGGVAVVVAVVVAVAVAVVVVVAVAVAVAVVVVVVVVVAVEVVVVVVVVVEVVVVVVTSVPSGCALPQATTPATAHAAIEPQARRSDTRRRMQSAALVQRR
jgi:hypothetical protein